MQAMLEVAEEDWWGELPQEGQAEIDKAAEQLDKEEGMSYEMVKEKFPQWFRK